MGQGVAGAQHHDSWIVKLMRFNMKNQRVCLWIIGWLLASCRGTPTPAPTPTVQLPPTARPTTELSPAIDYSEGVCEIPQGKYLFLKYSSHMSCSSACDCPVNEPPDSAISRSGDRVYYQSSRVNGNFKPWDPEDTTKGFIIYGWFEDQIFTFDNMPYEIPNTGKPIVGCEPSGLVYVEIDGEAFELEAEKSWSSQSIADEGDRCYRTYTVSIGNSGLVDGGAFVSDLSARNDHIQLEMVTNYFSLEEEIYFDILVSGQDNIDFSHFCSITFEMKEGDTWGEVGSCSNIPDYVPEPFPRIPGSLIEINFPISTMGSSADYQYELGVGEYRAKFTYRIRNELKALYSHPFRVVP